MISTRNQKGKQKVIHIISSSDEDEESEGADEVTEESDAEFTDDQESVSDSDDSELSSDDGGGSESDYADGDGNDDDVEEEEEEEDEGPREGKRSDEEIYNKIIDLIQRRRSLNALRLEECKVYLRKHHLRLSGAKEICIERILEHSRVKDGNAQKLYPWESFSINCTGDVCTGDVVRFKQRVYEKFDKATRGGGGKILGTRTIAGRVVKESYGAAKQQHTFTVEVLWSKGVKPLAPLIPLLVKGRNLYRMKTFRQRWSNETERSKILAEKHKRGAAARHTRATAKSRSSNIGRSKRNGSSSARAPPEKRRKKVPQPATMKNQNTSRTKSSSTAAKAITSRVKSSSTVKPVTQSRHTQPSTTVHTQDPLPKPVLSCNHLPQTNKATVAASDPKEYSQRGYVDRPQMPTPYNNYSAGHSKDNSTYNNHSASHPKDNGYHGHVDRPQMITPYNYHYAHMGFQQRGHTFTSHHSHNASFSSFATGAHDHMQNTGPYADHHPNPNPTPWFDDPRYPGRVGPRHFSNGPYFR